MNEYVLELGKKSKDASKKLIKIDTVTKNNFFSILKNNLDKFREKIKEQNQIDIENGENKGLTKAFLDRLLLTDSRIDGMLESIEIVRNFKDPIGEIVEGFRHSKGMEIKKVRVPLGVIAMIYESRPNVSIDASILCLKASNSIILRGGSDSINSNKVLVNIVRKSLLEANMPEDAVILMEKTEREHVNDLLKLNDYIDVAIPRGGKGLKKAIMENATIPVIETGAGVCHIYVDSEASKEKAIEIIINSKTQRPGVCNALETLLIHKDKLNEILPELVNKLKEKNVELRGDKRVLEIVNTMKEATEEDWDTEYLDLILAIKTVDSLDEAINHINEHSTKHSDAIITENFDKANTFTKEVDSACVYVNASTRFTDGGEFGFGGEIGISTQKLHARGPMGVRELTSLKYIISGNGQIR
ncbi:MAG: glutamate-5-semialdehyde dehydrogenase [Fusobacteriaceae bacterium]|nr:glutamate-5-semialdehyde dehydrogenase [Fusobacteriaceae bacterium]MBN2838839.1 glutamate-5-semialdehyde dehydrogenase [Fusobacteriaceae bacterium]